MSNNDFTHLHLHSQYSFLDGAIKINDLLTTMQNFKMNKVAITDHGNMFGALEFYIKAKAKHIKPILGIEIYITGKAKYTDKIRENFHLILLAENNQGYHNLKKLSSNAFIFGKYYYPRIDKNLLYKYKDGIIASSACLGGEIGQHFINNNIDDARRTIREFKKILGVNHYFLEIQPNKLEKQIKYNAFLAQIAKDEGLRLNATNDCHYTTKDQHDAQNILMAIRQQKTLNNPNLIKHTTDDFYIKSGDEMFNLLKNDYIEGFETACEIGKRCNVNIDIGHTYLPKFRIPKKSLSESEYLQNISTIGLKKRFNKLNYTINKEKYLNRLNSELNIIIKMGFSGYFLIVQDFINWAKKHKIKVGPGRGSGAGSLVAFALNITDIDPIEYNLLFERFLNPKRVSMPDFDIDFMQEGRNEVIKYVTNKYGRNHVGQIATYSALNPKSVIKDISRTLGIPFSEINQLTKPIPLLIDGKKPNLYQSLKYAPQLTNKAKFNPTYKRIITTSYILEGLYRQAGIHAGGIVIGKQELINYVPLFSGPNNELITQFDKNKVQLAGLVKFDFLGLKTLDVINSAEFLINKRIINENKNNNKLININSLTPNNKDVYKLISSGNTLGIFQLESLGFQQLCKKLKPDSFEDIIAAVALYRPGPMKAGMINEFIKRKHGYKKITYPHPLLEKILKPSYGTIIYQEQIMQATQILAGYSLNAADNLRIAISKKNIDNIKEQRSIFIEAAKKNKVDSKDAKKIFDIIKKFAGYSFNKSHAVSYAMITYQTAYLKCFYPVEFIAALLTTSSNSNNDIVKYINESNSNGINILPPDINISQRNFSVDYNIISNKQKIQNEKTYASIRFGLEAIKGLGNATLEAIIEARKINTTFKNIFHFCSCISIPKINKKILEALIKSGSMDSFNYPRKQLFANISKALKYAQSTQNDLKIGQINIFSKKTINNELLSKKHNIEEWTDKEKLQFEYQTLGFYLSGHPLNKHIEDIKRLGAISIKQLGQSKRNESVKIIGIISNIKEHILKDKAMKWAILTIEDQSGYAHILCFSKYYKEIKHILQTNEPILFIGNKESNEVDYENKKNIPIIKLKNATTLNSIKIQNIKLIQISISLKCEYST